MGRSHDAHRRWSAAADAHVEAADDRDPIIDRDFELYRTPRGLLEIPVRFRVCARQGESLRCLQVPGVIAVIPEALLRAALKARTVRRAD